MSNRYFILSNPRDFIRDEKLHRVDDCIKQYVDALVSLSRVVSPSENDILSTTWASPCSYGPQRLDSTC